jgi:hemoglobin-like flavoprotein
MTPKQIHIVQHTWLRVAPFKKTLARLFYAKLLEIDPGLRNLFQGDMRLQGEKFRRLMGIVVSGLNRLEHLLPVIRGLGKRHAGYGVKGYHSGALGAALLWALERCLRGEFTPQAKDAWTAVYGVLAQTMREAARERSRSMTARLRGT